MSDPVSNPYKLVPVEPTREMLNAAIGVDAFLLGDISLLGFRISPQALFERCWSAMLAASPTPKAEQPWVAELEGLREGIALVLDEAWDEGLREESLNERKHIDSILKLIEAARGGR